MRSTDIGFSLPRCKTHGRTKASMICETCSVELCTECSNNHQSNHDISSLELFYQEIPHLVSDMESHVQSAQNNLIHYSNVIENKKKQIKKEIEQKFDTIIQELINAKSKSSKQIDKAFESLNFTCLYNVSKTTTVEDVTQEFESIKDIPESHEKYKLLDTFFKSSDAKKFKTWYGTDFKRKINEELATFTYEVDYEIEADKILKVYYKDDLLMLEDIENNEDADEEIVPEEQETEEEDKGVEIEGEEEEEG